jgi:heavy metal efflux system protein
MKKIMFINVFLVLGISASCQTISMEEAVAEALKNNQNIKAAEDRLTAMRKTKNGVGLPKTEVSLLYGQYNSYSDNDNNITVSQTIPFTVFGSQASFNRAKISAGESERWIAENEIRYKVRRTYSQLQYQKAQHDFLIMQDSIYRGFLKAARLRHQSGEANLLEELTAESQSTEIQNLLKQNALEIESLESQLQLLMAVNARPAISRGVYAPFNVEVFDSTALAKSPVILHRERQVAVATAEKKLRSANAAPDLHVGFFSQTLIGAVNPRSGEIATGGDRFTGFQVGVGVPLWFGSYLGRVRAAEYEKQAALRELSYEKQVVQNQFEQGVRQLAVYQERLQYYSQVALPSAALLMRQSELSYREGEIGYGELLNGLRNSLAVRENYLKIVNEYNQTINYLQYLSGN